MLPKYTPNNATVVNVQYLGKRRILEKLDYFSTFTKFFKGINTHHTS